MKKSAPVILSTTIYEKSFRDVLNESHWFFKVESSRIYKKIIIVNNINSDSRSELTRLIDKFSDKCYFIDHLDVKKESLDRFNCDLREDEQSYWYSVQYFCQMLSTENLGCDYMLNVGADCKVQDYDIDDFIDDSIKILDNNDRVLLTTIPWAYGNEGDFTETGIHEQNIYDIQDRDESFWFSKVVSDQVFMTKTKKLLGGIFNIKENLHPFPVYGGDSFEKRFCNHLIKNDYLRAIYKKHYYIHNSY